MEKYEQTPSSKIFIPGLPPIEVPIIHQTANEVNFETSVILDLN